ncbi:MAG: methyltransferase domain-containing protein [Tepidisphaeraceae bacterium]
MRRNYLPWVVAVLVSVVAFDANLRAQETASAPVKKDVPYVPTPQNVVDRMLEMAEVKKGDTVYDLGCGDGRIIVTAAKKHGANGIGVDIDPQRIKESQENAQAAGVSEQVKFEIKDLFTMEFKDADVLAMYLLPDVNMKLRPKILDGMKPGSRIVSHSFDMDDWKPDAEDQVDDSTIYFWVVPAKVEGSWNATIKPANGGAGGAEQKATLELKQKFQDVTGTAKVDGKDFELKDAKLKGDALTFTLTGEGGDAKYTAKVDGSKLTGQDDKKATLTAEKK